MFSVVLDTCVLYPAYLRDTLLRIAAAGLYRPLWSEHILDELRRALPGPVTEEQRDRLIAQLRRMFPDALVHGYEPLIDTMTDHEKDRHVLAAAGRADAAAVVTFNLDDFPDAAVDPFDIEALHPDVFLLNQLDLAPGATLDVLEQQVAGYRRPSMTVYDLAAALERADCLQLADQLRLHLDEVTGPAYASRTRLTGGRQHSRGRSRWQLTSLRVRDRRKQLRVVVRLTHLRWGRHRRQ